MNQTIRKARTTHRFRIKASTLSKGANLAATEHLGLVEVLEVKDRAPLLPDNYHLNPINPISHKAHQTFHSRAHRTFLSRARQTFLSRAHQTFRNKGHQTSRSKAKAKVKVSTSSRNAKIAQASPVEVLPDSQTSNREVSQVSKVAFRSKEEHYQAPRVLSAVPAHNVTKISQEVPRDNNNKVVFHNKAVFHNRAVSMASKVVSRNREA